MERFKIKIYLVLQIQILKSSQQQLLDNYWKDQLLTTITFLKN